MIISDLLHKLPVSELWGVGSRYAAMLRRNEIRTAAQLRDAPDEWISQTMTVNGLRLAHELRGFPCKLLELDSGPEEGDLHGPQLWTSGARTENDLGGPHYAPEPCG